MRRIPGLDAYHLYPPDVGVARDSDHPWYLVAAVADDLQNTQAPLVGYVFCRHGYVQSMHLSPLPSGEWLGPD